jgi:hypothetical protein
MASTADGAVPVDSDGDPAPDGCHDPQMPEPLAQLPHEVGLDVDEVREVLFAVDLPVELSAARSSDEARARRAQRLSTTKLWPDLGELLNQDDPEG